MSHLATVWKFVKICYTWKCKYGYCIVIGLLAMAGSHWWCEISIYHIYHFIVTVIHNSYLGGLSLKSLIRILAAINSILRVSVILSSCRFFETRRSEQFLWQSNFGCLLLMQINNNNNRFNQTKKWLVVIFFLPIFFP